MFILGTSKWVCSAVRHLWATFHLLSVIFILNMKNVYQNNAVDLYNDFHPTASKNIILIAKGLFMPILWNKGRLSLALIRHPGKLGPTEHSGALCELCSFSSPCQANGQISKPLFWCKSWLTRTLNKFAALKVTEEVKHRCHVLTPWFAVPHPHLVPWSSPQPSSPALCRAGRCCFTIAFLQPRSSLHTDPPCFLHLMYFGIGENGAPGSPATSDLAPAAPSAAGASLRVDFLIWFSHKSIVSILFMS